MERDLKKINYEELTKFVGLLDVDAKNKTLSQICFGKKAMENVFEKDDISFTVKVFHKSISSLLKIRKFLEDEGFNIIGGFGNLSGLPELSKLLIKLKNSNQENEINIIKNRIKEITEEEAKKCYDEESGYSFTFDPINEKKMIFRWYDFVKAYGERLLKLSKTLKHDTIKLEIVHKDNMVSGFLGINYKSSDKKIKEYKIYNEVHAYSSLLGVQKVYSLIYLLDKIAQNQNEFDFLNGEIAVNKTIYEFGVDKLQNIVIKYIKRRKDLARIIKEDE